MLKNKEHLITGIVKFFDTKDEAAEYENQVVTESLLLDPLCLNLKVGGIGGNVSAESRKKISNANKTASKEVRLKRGSANRGKSLKDETLSKMSKAHTGKVYSQEMRIQKATSLFVTPLGTFSSSVEASKAHNCSYQAIIRCCDSTKAEFNGYARFKKR